MADHLGSVWPGIGMRPAIWSRAIRASATAPAAIRELVKDIEAGHADELYCCCQACKTGFFPLDERWRLNESGYSDSLSQQAGKSSKSGLCLSWTYPLCRGI